MALSIGTWVLGRVMDKPKMSHLGMHLLRAQAVTEILMEPVKFATHRERPDGSNHQSFPSGHAAITFAAAVGAIVGRTVTEHGRETWTLGPMAVPGGVAIGATRTGF
jgi:membrane-associated phospholipid phosphatase